MASKYENIKRLVSEANDNGILYENLPVINDYFLTRIKSTRVHRYAMEFAEGHFQQEFARIKEYSLLLPDISKS
jgi:hypothetical protein